MNILNDVDASVDHVLEAQAKLEGHLFKLAEAKLKLMVQLAPHFNGTVVELGELAVSILQEAMDV